MVIDRVETSPPAWELSGDQYELFPLPPGPARMFRQLLGQPDPPPELISLPQADMQDGNQYEFFPELGAALKPKPEPSPDMVDNSVLEKLQQVLNPSADSLGKLLEPLEPVAKADAAEPTGNASRIKW